MRRALVILENGSRWPTWLDDQDLSGVDLVAQRPGENGVQLARRVVERLTQATAPPTATLVCGAVGSASRDNARATILRALLGAAAQAGGGHVILAADGTASHRRSLVELATRLNREIRDEPGVALRFRALPRGSQNTPRRRVA